ncbi:MAG: VanZ family protein [Zhenhengia sp.]|uniref:VanZ family protein n=1 Tax=Zhenhengia sp. TaxID=2944208 RepID=UPI00399652E1
MFLIYLYLALNKAGIGSIWDIGKYDTIVRLEEINLIPFQAGGFMTHILNIIMFMPLGFLLPLIWKSFRNGVGVLVTGVGFSLAIEIAQLFNRRLTDVDDLIMNTMGTLIGFIIWKVFTKIFKRKEATHFSLQVNEGVVYITLSVLGTFCLHI